MAPTRGAAGVPDFFVSGFGAGNGLTEAWEVFKKTPGGRKIHSDRLWARGEPRGPDSWPKVWFWDRRHVLWTANMCCVETADMCCVETANTRRVETADMCCVETADMCC